MTKTFITLAIAAIMTLTACSGSNNADSAAGTNDSTAFDLELPNGTPGLAKSIIDNDLFIDIDSASIEETMNVFNVCTRRQIYGEDIPAIEITDRINDNISKMKAAGYRFFSKLTVEGNQMILAPGTTAESLKMPDYVFDRMKADLDQSNEFYRRQQEAGDTTSMEPITQEYLNSMLD